ncbi:MAG: DUF2520 domain-containing protein [Bdellovibrionales bacterium]
MSQTNLKSYALLGSGRVARHFQFYIKTLRLPVLLWSRDGNPEFNSFSEPEAQARLAQVVGESSHVLFAVSDRAIEEVSAPYLNTGKTLVHFSGAARIANVHAAHPLMTFAAPLENPDWYLRIPFVIDEGQNLAELLPGLGNPSFALAPSLRPLYHALASLAGNSSFLLWQNIGNEFEDTLGLPRAALAPFLHQVVENAVRGARGGFTGPVARGDWQTVSKHLKALHHTPLAESYRDFLNLAGKSGHPVPQEIL